MKKTSAAIDSVFIGYFSISLLLYVTNSSIGKLGGSYSILLSLYKSDFIIASIWCFLNIDIILRRLGVVNIGAFIMLGLLISIRPVFTVWSVGFNPVITASNIGLAFLVLLKVQGDHQFAAELKKKVIWVFILVTILVPVMGLSNLAEPGRLILLNGDGNFTSVILFSFLMLGFFCFNGKYTRFTIFLIYFLFVYYTRSRMGVIGFISFGGYLIIMQNINQLKRNFWKPWKSITLGFLLLSMFGQLLLFEIFFFAGLENAQRRIPIEEKNPITSILNIFDTSNAGRVLLAKSAWEEVISNTRVMLWGNPYYLNLTTSISGVVHNWFIASSIQNGILISLCFAFLIFRVVQNSLFSGVPGFYVLLFFGGVLSMFPIGIPLLFASLLSGPTEQLLANSLQRKSPFVPQYHIK